MSLPSELFQENVYHEVYFWKSNRLLPLTFTKVNSIVVVVREFSESFEAIIKSRLCLHNFTKDIISDRVISGKIRLLLCIFLKNEFSCCRFWGVLQNFQNHLFKKYIERQLPNLMIQLINTLDRNP